jgi:hypothetical protein
MSTAAYDHDMPNAYTFCAVSGNPPVWGCSLCDWRFPKKQFDTLPDLPSLERAKAAHKDHICPTVAATN